MLFFGFYFLFAKTPEKKIFKNYLLFTFFFIL